MLTRHTARELVLQALFNVDFSINIDTSPEDVFSNIYDTFYKEKDKEKKKDEFALELFNGVLLKKEEIDTMIEKTSSEWSLEKTAIIDRNILRVGLYEMFFVDTVPARVAINESIELARTFGHKNSYKFVSGVLGTIYETSGLKEEDKKIKNKK